MNQTTAEVGMLRRAAHLIRERAEAATPGPWGDPQDISYGEFGWNVYGCPAGETEDSEQGKADITFIASWHPAVALAVADWLDVVARRWPTGRSSVTRERASALAVARAYLDHS